MSTFDVEIECLNCGAVHTRPWDTLERGFSVTTANAHECIKCATDDQEEDDG